MKKTKTKTKITNTIIKQVEELSEQGFSNILISKSLNIGLSTLSININLIKAIHRGRLSLAKKVTSYILETLEDNPAVQQLLIKRLCLFNPLINIKKPNNAKEALDNLATAIKQYADGEINESQLRTIEATSNSYTKGYEATVLEERISELEKSIG